MATLLNSSNQKPRYFLVIFRYEGDLQTFKMATSKSDSNVMFGGSKMSSLEDDFTYGVTVAQTNINVRLGLYFRVFIPPFKPQKVI